MGERIEKKTERRITADSGFNMMCFQDRKLYCTAEEHSPLYFKHRNTKECEDYIRFNGSVSKDQFFKVFRMSTSCYSLQL